MNKATTFLVILMLFALSQSAYAEDTALLRELSKSKTAGYMIWTVMTGKNDFIDLRCLVTKDPELGHELKIFDSKQPKHLLKFKRGDSFVGMFPTSDAGDLVTIWLGGSAFHFYVFSFQKNKINLTLETGSYMMPEFVTIDGNEKPAIIIVSDTRRDKNSVRQATAATIYQWDGAKYLKSRTADWKDRFRVLDK